MKNVKAGLMAALLLASAASASAQNTTNTWTGGVSTDWSNAANWSQNRVPLATDNVLIQGPSQAMYYPYVNGQVAAYDLILASGAVLYLQNTALVSVYGNITNSNGSMVGVGRGTVSLRGAGKQLISGPGRTSFRNLVVGPNGAEVASSVAVERGLIVQGKLTIGAGQDFSLLSTSTGPGYVVNAGGGVDGTVTVQRYIDPSQNPGLGYRHLSSPVANANFTTLQGPGYTPIFNPAYNTSTQPNSVQPFPTVFGYDQNGLITRPGGINMSDFDKGWYSPAATDPMTPGHGFTVNLPGAATGASGVGRVVSFTGTLTEGNLTMPVARGPQADQGWNLLGNPYASPLDWDRVIANPNTQGIGTALYVAKSTGQYTGTYASYVNGVGTNGGTNVLPLGQAYFVFANTGGQVAYTNSQRLSSDSTLFQRGTASTPLMGTRLLLSGAIGNCEAIVTFTAGATNGFDGTYDALSIPVGALRVATQTPANEVLAINSLPLLSNQAVAVPLTFSAAVGGTYLLSRTEGTLPAGFMAYLLDSQTNAVTNLSTAPAASITLSAGTSAPGHFALLYSPTAPLSAAKPFAAIGAGLYPNPASGSVFVLLHERTGAATVEITNMLGQSVLRRKLASGTSASQELPLTGIAPGVYSVRLTTANGQVAQRLIIN